jgi:beta-fructofuranosidase
LTLIPFDRYLPTGWTIPYTPGTETQNLAWTEDGGVTWKKLETNPVIGGPPKGMNITAFRDPVRILIRAN